MDTYVNVKETAQRYRIVHVKLVGHFAHHDATVVGDTAKNVHC
jgi:hypothetical protein